MPWVSPKLAKILKLKDAKMISGTEGIIKLLQEVKNQIIIELSHIPEAEFTSYQLKKSLAGIQYSLDRFKGSAQKQLGGLLDDSWGFGEDLVDAYAASSGIVLGFGELPQSVLNTMKDYAFHKLGSMSDAAWDQIRGQLSLGVLGQKTPHEVMQSIIGQVDKPSIFGSIENRAEVITKTEMGKTFSRATFERMKQVDKIVPGMMKEWKHRGHPKQPRPTHLWADGNRVPVAEAFSIGGISMMYPRDPNAPVSEIVNCG